MHTHSFGLVFTVFLYPMGLLALPQQIPGTGTHPPAQISSDSPRINCTFACPTVDSRGLELVRTPLAVSPTNDWYTIFQCMYAPKQEQAKAHACSYSKHTGVQSMGSEGDNCPPVAACYNSNMRDSTNNPPFSGQDERGKDLHYEVPAWVEFGRYQLWLKGHSEHA